MHEEATSMSVPGSVAVSTGQTENGTSTISVENADLDLEVTTDDDNVELQMSFSSNSGALVSQTCFRRWCSGSGSNVADFDSLLLG
nr:unnamed protein product [Callosobruchus chinensis]